MINRGWMPPHPTLYIRRELYEKHGPYNLCYNTAADYDFMLRMLKDEDLLFCYLPEVLVKMRTGGVSNRGISEIFTKSREDLMIMRSQNLPFPLFALMNKNFSKISQFWRK
jgi:glycosyltransferase